MNGGSYCVIIAFGVTWSTATSRPKVMMVVLRMMQVQLMVVVVRIVYWSISASRLYVHLIDSGRGRFRRWRHNRRKGVVDFSMVVGRVFTSGLRHVLLLVLPLPLRLGLPVYPPVFEVFRNLQIAGQGRVVKVGTLLQVSHQRFIRLAHLHFTRGDNFPLPPPTGLRFAAFSAWAFVQAAAASGAPLSGTFLRIRQGLHLQLTIHVPEDALLQLIVRSRNGLNGYLCLHALLIWGIFVGINCIINIIVVVVDIAMRLRAAGICRRTGAICIFLWSRRRWTSHSEWCSIFSKFFIFPWIAGSWLCFQSLVATAGRNSP